MRFEETSSDGERLEQYSRLFAASYGSAKVIDRAYLAWLYRDNPDGPVLGFDAIENGELVGTYVCVPAVVRWDKKSVKALLSLNTATHPKHRGKGLFTKLAQATYERARQSGFDIVFGVANQNSIHGFSTKLGFQNVCGLNARIGMGRFPCGDVAEIQERSSFHREWSAQALRWRIGNPQNPLAVKREGDGSVRLIGRTQYPGIAVQAALFQSMPEDFAASQDDIPFSFGAVSLGLEPSGTSSQGWSLAIPERLKPSPLRLIYRNLRDETDRIDDKSVLFRFIDFDAY